MDVSLKKMQIDATKEELQALCSMDSFCITSAFLTAEAGQALAQISPWK